MFNVLEGGVSEPIKWGMDNLTPDRSIIILDESNQIVWLWHGSRQGLVARRTALRQAESLKGHGYTVGKSIIGRDLKVIKEIDQRKIGRETETDNYNEALQKVLTRDFKELDQFVVTFEMVEGEKPAFKPVIREETKPSPIIKPEPKPVVKEPIPLSKPEPAPAIRTETKIEIKTEPVSMPKLDESPKKEIISDSEPNIQAKIGFVLMGILDHYDDIWVSKKEEGTFSVEMMDGPICSFKISQGSKITFSADSFKGISTNVKTEIQKKFVELSKLL